MPKYKEKVVETYHTPDRGIITTPHTPNLFKIQDSRKIKIEYQEQFHSTVMRIMFYAIGVRPDILCTLNFLSTRTRLGTATSEDEAKLL